MKKILKIAAWLVILLAAGIAIVMVWYRSATRPQVEGTLSLPGLHAKADVVRDAEGIPHIYAANAEDAYFALGFVHAQDRLWQMEMNRRIAAGRLAEILGPSALDTDRFLRTLGVRRNAEAIVSGLSADARQVLEAYASGVNAYLAQRKEPLPPEFILTGAPPPEPWKPADSIGWQTMMAWDLGSNWSQELLRMRAAQRLTTAQINEFLAPYPGEQPVVTRDFTQLYRELSGTTAQLAAVAKIAPPSLVEGMGSNNWVVSGALSTSGKPLLANDPHLGLSAPSLWYFAHLSAPGLNVIGATMPALPGVVLGRNDRIAWGFTNTGSDVQDLFIEEVDPANPDRYRTPEGWAAFDKSTELIKVKGAADVALEVRRTRHGPVITGALPILAKAPIDAKRYVVAFAWTALLPDDKTFEAALKFGRASNWQEFTDAARSFHAPQQNIGYADVDGNIGFIAPARVPLRKPENDLKGLAPAPGWDARYDWNGFIPFDDLPHSYNPVSQRIVTANEKIVPDNYPYWLTSEWVLPYRAIRINAMLDNSLKHDIASFSEMQGDVMSIAAQELLSLMRRAKPQSPRAKTALDLLMRWDGAMQGDRAEPLIFAAWTREASRRIFEDELSPDLMADYWEHRNVHRSMVNVLKDLQGQGRWCDDTAAKKKMSCDELLSASLDAAIADLAKRYGGDMERWRWAAAHTAYSEHRPFSKVGWLASWFDIREPTPGDTFTVNAGRYSLRDEENPFASRHAASLRAIYDLSDPEKSVFIHSSGQSGNVFSPLYRSYAERWAAVKYLPMKTKRVDVEQGRIGTLTLTPG